MASRMYSVDERWVKAREHLPLPSVTTPIVHDTFLQRGHMPDGYEDIDVADQAQSQSLKQSSASVSPSGSSSGSTTPTGIMPPYRIINDNTDLSDVISTLYVDPAQTAHIQSLARSNDMNEANTFNSSGTTRVNSETTEASSSKTTGLAKLVRKLKGHSAQDSKAASNANVPGFYGRDRRNDGDKTPTPRSPYLDAKVKEKKAGKKKSSQSAKDVLRNKGLESKAWADIAWDSKSQKDSVNPKLPVAEEMMAMSSMGAVEDKKPTAQGTGTSRYLMESKMFSPLQTKGPVTLLREKIEADIKKMYGGIMPMPLSPGELAAHQARVNDKVDHTIPLTAEQMKRPVLKSDEQFAEEQKMIPKTMAEIHASWRQDIMLFKAGKTIPTAKNEPKGKAKNEFKTEPKEEPGNKLDSKPEVSSSTPSLKYRFVDSDSDDTVVSVKQGKKPMRRKRAPIYAQPSGPSPRKYGREGFPFHPSYTIRFMDFPPGIKKRLFTAMLTVEGNVAPYQYMIGTAVVWKVDFTVIEKPNVEVIKALVGSDPEIVKTADLAKDVL